MAELSQVNAPIYEALRRLRRMRVVPFDVPGHKRGRGNMELTEFLGEDCMNVDVNSMKPLDNLCHPVSVIKDAEDLAEAERLAQGVREKLDGMACPPDAPLEVDGTPYPYSGYYVPRGRDGEAMDIRKVHPATKDQCIHCGRCIRVCRMGSIDPSDPAKSTGICIKCGACIKACPVGAKYFSDVRYLFHIHDLEQRYARRGENKIFL